MGLTATAHRLSLSNLHERIALAGPADKLKDLADTFDAMLDRSERSADSQRRFAANASHELRAPLAIQRAAIQIGLDNPSPDRRYNQPGGIVDVVVAAGTLTVRNTGPEVPPERIGDLFEPFRR